MAGIIFTKVVRSLAPRNRLTIAVNQRKIFSSVSILLMLSTAWHTNAFANNALKRNTANLINKNIYAKSTPRLATSTILANKELPLIESRTATSNFINRASNLIVDKAFTEAVAYDEGISSFLTGQYDNSKIKTGVYTNTYNTNMIAGFSTNNVVKAGKLTASVFYENGFGGYDNGNLNILTNGDSNYNGFGAMARFTFNETNNRQAYIEASAHGGTIKTDYYARDLTNNQTIAAQNNSSAKYYGGHIGAGYSLIFLDKDALNFYGRYIFNHVNGTQAVVSNNTIDFSGVDSQRVQIGSRYSVIFQQNNIKLIAYIGVAVEYEFAGKANASTYYNGILYTNVDSTTMDGMSGMGELGIAIKPSVNGNYFFDASLQAFTGQRQGIGINASFKYKF